MMAKREESMDSNSDLEKVLIQNFVSLQKVMTNLSVKFDELTSQISKLLELFEISAKTIAEKKNFGNDKEVNEKINNLMEQNRTLAKGLTLLHENKTPQRPMQPPMRRMPPQNNNSSMNNAPKEEYTKSESPEKKDGIDF